MVPSRQGSRSDREMKMIHAPGNQNRRIFNCAFKLSMEPTREEVLFRGLTAYSSTTDSATVTELRPKETVNIRFEVNFQNALTTNADQWRDRSKDGIVLGRVECNQQILTSAPDAAAGERKYQGRMSDLLRSNEIQISIQP